MALNNRLDLRQLDAIVRAHQLARQIQAQNGPAARALVGTMVEELIRRLAQPSALPFMAGLGATRLCVFPLNLAIGRGRFGGGA
jgi:hypothetical protein